MIELTMRWTCPVRCIGLLVFVGSGAGFAQSTLPATNPTVAQTPAAQRFAAPPAEHRAVIVYSLGQLTVLADNSNLNQILRDIAQQTGMKLVGQVSDQRVYGKYGPGAAAEILAGLLDGTGSNMILRETASSAPAELILTPREGGGTPSDSDAIRENAARDDAQAEDQDRSGDRDGGRNQPNPISQPDADQPRPEPRIPRSDYLPGGIVPGGQPATPPPPGAYIPPPPPAQNSPSPEGAATPQQIYQQLQQMQQPQPASAKP